MFTRFRLAIFVVAASPIAVSLPACAGSLPASAPSKMSVAPMKSNGSGISVQYLIDGQPQAGRALNLLVTFGGVTDPAGATVRMVADSGLSLSPGFEAVQSLPVGESTTLTVPVVSGSGVGYLHLFTTQHGITSATSIAVQSDKADTALPQPGQLKQAPGGDRILSMPVK